MRCACSGSRARAPISRRSRRPGFPGLRLDELLPLREREQMDDASMVDYLLRSAVGPDQPRPSIETLLHAFVPRHHVDHTHPDAVIALTSTPSGRQLAEEDFGDEAVWLDYQRPGLRHVAPDRAAARRAPDGARRAAREARARHLGRDRRGELRARRSSSSRARREAIDRHGRGRFGLGGPGVARAHGRRRGRRCSPRRCRRCAARCSRTRTASCSRSTGAPRRSPSPRPRARPR